MGIDQRPLEPAPPGQLYLSAEYNRLDRFAAYWTQINEVFSLKPHTVLEVGVGSQVVVDYLRRRQFQVVGVDLRTDAAPDVAGAVGHLPFCADAFHLVMACQLLEHLPFEQFEPILSDMARVSSRYIVISLPDAGRYLSVSLRASHTRTRRWLVDLSRLLPRGGFKPTAHHYWELGWREYPLARITSTIQRTGLQILRHYRVVERPYQHFFILQKQQ